MLRRFSLDLFLLQSVGAAVDAFTSAFTNQPPFHRALYESFARGSYQELDYQKEARNQAQFRRELAARNSPVVVPAVVPQYTTRKVLTTEWIEGRRLADCPVSQIRKLIPVGVELFLTQLLDIGAFHADPHPGNLLVNRHGQLCLLDFGLCAEVDEKSRAAMTRAIVHLLLQDFETLISRDAIELGFLPENIDTTELQPLLTKILTVGIVEGGSSNLRERRKKLGEISSELNEVFFRYPFSVPPFFALVTRGLGLLEGIALSGDPEFDIFRASAPFARRRAVALLGRHTWNRAKAQQHSTGSEPTARG
jgi:aarF domain-containing kinase